MKKKKQHDIPAKSNSSGKLLRITLIVALIFLSALYVVYRVNFNNYKIMLENTLARQWDASVSIGSIRFYLLRRQALRLSDVTIKLHGNGTAVTSHQILCYVDIKKSFSSKKLAISSIALIQPSLTIRKDVSPANTTQTADTPSPDSVADVAARNVLPAIDSSFTVDTISIVNGSLELFDMYTDYLMLKRLDLNAELSDSTIDFTLTAQIKDAPGERIRVQGAMTYSDKLETRQLLESWQDAMLHASISLDDISVQTIRALIPEIPSQYNPEKINLSGSIQASYNAPVKFDGRIAPQTHLPAGTFIDVAMSMDLNKQFISLDNLVSNINESGLYCDGFYDLQNKQGELYLQTEPMNIEQEKHLFPFLKSLDLEGIATVSAVAGISDEIDFPSIRGHIAVQEFSGLFDNLNSPLILQSPTIASFSNNQILFPLAHMTFNGTPLDLKLRYELVPEQKLFLTIDNFSSIQLLEIFSESAQYLKKTNTSQQTDTNNEQKPSDVSENNTKNSRSRHSSHVPIYISAHLTDAYLYMAHFSTLFVDAFVDNNRMIFKSIDINMYDGNMRGNGIIDLNEGPAYSFILDMEDINTNLMLSRNTSFKDIFYGTLTAAIAFQCSGINSVQLIDSLKSNGTLRIYNGQINNFELLTQIMQRFSENGDDKKYQIIGSTIGLSIPPLEELDLGETSEFQKLTCDYEIKKNEDGKTAFFSDSIKIDSIKMKLKMYGSFDMDHNLDFHGETLLSTIQTHKILHKVRELGLLFPIEDNRMRIPFKLKGTLEKPLPSPIIKMNNIQQKWERIIENKLLQKSEDIDPAFTDDALEYLDEKSFKKYKKIKKKFKKYLE